jgi:predicted nucleic acid-binding protein
MRRRLFHTPSCDAAGHFDGDLPDPPDPTDRYVLAAAAAGRAELIVSGDAGLLAMYQVEFGDSNLTFTVPIVSAREALDLL